jgi:putative membrane protein
MQTPRWMSQATSDDFSWSDALGGTRGVIEATAPGLVFVVVYVATRALVPTLIAALCVALLACVIRLVQRQGLQQALSGLFGVAIGVIFAAATGRGENYFAWGIVTNIAMALVFAVSVLLRRGLVAQFYGPLTGLPKGWQSDPTYADLRRSCSLLTWMWAGIFALRVLVQAPLWLGGQVAALGVAKLILGLPLFGLGAWATWWGLRRYSSSSDDSSDSGEATN